MRAAVFDGLCENLDFVLALLLQKRPDKTASRRHLKYLHYFYFAVSLSEQWTYFKIGGISLKSFKHVDFH